MPSTESRLAKLYIEKERQKQQSARDGFALKSIKKNLNKVLIKIRSKKIHLMKI